MQMLKENPIKVRQQGGSRYRLMTLSAMFAALIAVMTAYLCHIPLGGNSGYAHLGDAFVYLAAATLPLPYACAAASIGGGLADFLSGAPIWVVPTMLIKPLIALAFTSKNAKYLCRRNVVALFLGYAISTVGYYLAEALLFGDWLAPLALQWGGVIQSGGSAVVFVLIGTALDRLHFKERFAI